MAGVRNRSSEEPQPTITHTHTRSLIARRRCTKRSLVFNCCKRIEMCALSQMISEFPAGAGVVRLTSPAVSNNNLALNEWPSNFWHCITVETLYFFFSCFLSFFFFAIIEAANGLLASRRHTPHLHNHARTAERNKQISLLYFNSFSSL